MSRAFLCLVAVWSLTWARPAPAQIRFSQPPRDNIVQTGTGAIKGRVVDAASGQPARKVRVHAASAALRDGRTAYTDAGGWFELKTLPAGHYTVTAFKPSYVSAAYGQPRPLELGKAIEVLEGQTVDRIDIGLVRAGVISGKITDEFGEPLADTQVMAMRYQFVQGTRRLMPAGGRMTNDIGEFRVFGLAPGHYYLAATLRNDRPDPNDRETYASTYYPGTPSLSGAQVLTITQGQTMTGMSMMLLPVRSVRVSGTVSDSAGRPLRGAFVSAEVPMGIGAMTSRGGGTAAPDGTFSIPGLAPGDYVLRVSTNIMAGQGEGVAMPLSVGTSDITDVHLVTSKPSTISGRVLVDRAELGTLKGSTFRLMTPAASPDQAAMTGGPTGTPANDDFTFALSVRPGHVFIRSNTVGWFLRAVRVNGVDVMDSGVEIRPNEPLTGVDVELTHRQPELTGTVKTAEGALTRNAFVVVFPQDRRHWGYLSRYVRMSRPNPDNQYRVQVPPGEYLAIAVDFVEQGEWSEPEFLERVRERAVPFSLAEGEHNTLGLTLVSLSRN
jgi:hypothetical protein